jgi:hypothetical protein
LQLRFVLLRGGRWRAALCDLPRSQRAYGFDERAALSSRHASALEWAAALAAARNPAERSVLCAMARFANRTNGVVQEPRAGLAAAAMLSVASFRTHAAALADRERGLIAATTLRSEHGDYDTTIYTLIGWLHLRGMSEPAHLRVDADAGKSAHEEEGSAKLAHGGLPKSSRPGVVEFIRPSAEIEQTPAKSQQTPNIDYSSNLIGLDLDKSLSSSLFPRARGSTGGLRGDAGEVVALVNHVKLDPSKAPDLVTSTCWLETWKRSGLTVEEIALVICAVLEKRDRRNPRADHITTWNFFTKAMREHATAKAAAAAGLVENVDVLTGSIRPRNAAEQQQAYAGARRASWARVLGEREAPERDEAAGSQRVAGGD